jgi:hypothetical protein
MVIRIAVVALALVIGATASPRGVLKAAPADSALSWDVDAREPYAGGRARGRVTSCRVTPGTPPRGAVVVVGGIASAAEPGADPAAACRFPRDSWQAYARSRGFTLYILTWYRPTDYIQRNAFVLTALIEQLRSRDPAAATGGLVIVGPGMGGLVARYALAYMEAQQQAHGVRLFVSVDSPHRGAYVPIGIQFVILYLANRWGNVDARRLREEQIDSPAARQMLVHHPSRPYDPHPQTDLYEQLYVAELRDRLGNFPSARGMRMVAIANGRGDGRWETPLPGSLLLHWQSRPVVVDRRRVLIRLAVPSGIPIVGGRVLFERRVPITTRAQLDVRANALRGGGLPETVFAARLALTMNDRPVDYKSTASVRQVLKAILSVEIPDTPNIVGFSPRRVWNDEADRILQPYAVAVVKRVAEYLDANPRYKPLDIRVASAFSHEGAPGGRSNKTEDAATLLRRSGGGAVGTVQPYHNFIPTMSALGVDRSPGLSLLGLGDALGPFAKVYYHEANTGHLEGSADRFIRQEIARLVGGP